MNWVNYNQLHEDVIEFAKQVQGTDIVLGVARSGVLPAAMLATHLNIKLGVVDREGNITTLSGGQRDDESNSWVGKNILVLDDSLDTGNTLESVRREVYLPRTTFAAIYDAGANHHFQGKYLFGRVLEQPRMFAWNFMNHDFLGRACMDIDGVITHDCDEATPKFTPRRRIRSLITGRLEERRQETEDMLKHRGIEYDELLMRKSKDTDCEEFKAQIYDKNDARIFIESSEYQARKITEISGKPVICIETMELYEGRQPSS